MYEHIYSYTRGSDIRPYGLLCLDQGRYNRKQVPLLHNTVLILCDEGNGLVALSDVFIMLIMLINVKMPTVVGILTLMSRINSVLS